MSKKNEKVAFVAMKFTGNPWSDKRYVIMTEVLEEAGYVVRRGDELQSSGEAIREVLALLRDADLVVIDASGDSHNVSYEIGYCHGVARPPSETILLRSSESALPFNYSHYRHMVYHDHRTINSAMHLPSTRHQAQVITAHLWLKLWSRSSRPAASRVAVSTMRATPCSI